MRRLARRRAHAWAMTSNTSAETNVAGPPGGGISAKTVEAHVSAVLRKLQLSNRHELSRWAAERRLD